MEFQSTQNYFHIYYIDTTKQFICREIAKECLAGETFAFLIFGAHRGLCFACLFGVLDLGSSLVPQPKFLTASLSSLSLPYLYSHSPVVGGDVLWNKQTTN